MKPDRFMIGVLGAAVVAGLCLAAAQETSVVIRVDGRDRGRAFGGIGGVSAGASTRLLYDYPEPVRSDILDYLFKPDFGASMQSLKVEIGSDGNTTCGSEPSHARTEAELRSPVFERGYEYWLVAEARKRNPDIVLNALEWGTPAWTNGHWTGANADYIVSFLKGAEAAWKTRLDFVSPGRNEGAMNPEWLVSVFKPRLDAAGLQRTKILAPDDDDHFWQFFDLMAKDPALAKVVDAVGYHYIEAADRAAAAEAKASGKELWASEDGSRSGSWEDCYWYARFFNQAYVRDRVTTSIVWPPIDGIYNILPWADRGPMSADTPWSGHYVVEPGLWAFAHTNQCAKTGWQYLDGACGTLDNGGNYVALRSPDGRAWSVIVVNGLTEKRLALEVGGGLRADALQVWKSDVNEQFTRQADLKILDGRFELVLAPKAIYSLTTLDSPTHGVRKIPPDRPFPFPYADDFESTALAHPGRYFADIEGGFEVVPSFDSRGRNLRQMVDVEPSRWEYDFAYRPVCPLTIIGDKDWTDYAVETDVLLEKDGWAGINARLAEDPKVQNQGYCLSLNAAGAWDLKVRGLSLAAGIVDYRPGAWARLRLECRGDLITGSINGRRVVSMHDASIKGGLAALSSGYNFARFDNFAVAPVR
jgi:galactosylceramidase